ncbi:MAG TPA: periplasmic heavy metal sensor [Rhizomicrobium sp.]
MSNGSPQGKSNVALIISLCINLVLAGVIAMGGYRAFHHGPMFGNTPGFEKGYGGGHGQRPMGSRALMHLLPAETGKVKAVADAHRDRVFQLRSEARQARRDVLRTFASPDFSQQAFDRALERVRNADAALEAEELKVVSESVAALTPDERRAAVERAREHRGFGMHRGGRSRGF